MLKVKEILKEKGITLTELANRIGMSPPSLSRALNSNTTVEVLQKISDELEVDIADLFKKKHETIHVIINNKLHTFHSKKELKNFIDINF